MLMVTMACGGGAEPAGDPGAAQQLVIPPMDAGAAPPLVIVDASAPATATTAPETTEALDEETARDPRATTPPRSESAIQAELGRLEAQVKTTSSPTPDLLRTLMDDYAELARARTGAAPSRAAALLMSIAHADRLMKDHPTYARADEVRYYRGLAYEQTHQFRQARTAFYELVKNNPGSKLIGCAYFAFGEMFKDEANAVDPSKFDLAKQAFAESVKYPAAENTCFQLAKTRLASLKP